MSPAADRWIAADWGTSRLRLWRMEGDAPRAMRDSAEGMGGLAADGFEAAFLRLAGDWVEDRTGVLVCGMAGAREGWAQAPYLALPARPDDIAAGAVRAPTTDPRLDARILPGVAQAGEADVMRGEETQVLGLLRRAPGFEGLACLPGSHSKWVRIAAGRITGFHTFMTGELFAAIAGATVLRRSVDCAEAPAQEDVVAAALETAAAPGRLARSLFSIRAAALLDGVGPAASRARLSGLLIGFELADALADAPPGCDIALIGADPLSGQYAAALAALGFAPRRIDGADATLAGLCAARARMQEMTA